MTDAEARIWQRYAMDELYGDKEGMARTMRELWWERNVYSRLRRWAKKWMRR